MRRIEYKGVEERQWDNYTTFAVMYDYRDGGSRNVGCIFICSSGTMSAHILFAQNFSFFEYSSKLYVGETCADSSRVIIY